MKNVIKGIGFICLFLAGAFFVNAQSTFPVSKGVQRYANKGAFDEETQKSNIQAKSVEFPAIAVSKGVIFPTNVETAGNIESRGYPTWAISKGVARQNEEHNQKKAGSLDYSPMDISKDENQISKR